MAQVGSFVEREWKILIVDYDNDSLLRLEEMLQYCRFKVTKCRYAKEAIRILEEDRNHYDLVIVDVYLTEMNGFELLNLIGIETNLPVIMTSIDDDNDQIRKGMLYGASDYLIKPIQMENVRYLWKYVYGKQRHEELIKARVAQSGSNSSDIINMNYYCKRVSKNAWIAPISDHGKRKIADINGDQQMNDDATTTKKKQRVVWTPQLHAKFMEAIKQLGTEKPVPKKILEIMNVPELTRENVASHLQKYRQYHKRMEQTLQYQSENLPPISSDEHNHTSSCSLQLQGLNSHSQAKVSKTELGNYSQVVHHVKSSNVFYSHSDSHAYSTTFDSTIEGQIFGFGDVSCTRVDDDTYASYILDHCYNDPAALYTQLFGNQSI